MLPIVSQSNDASLDHLCGQQPALTSPFVTASLPLAPTAFNDRCGNGQRLPMLVISPFARRNYVGHTITDTTSILGFIEDNRETGRIDSLDHPNGTPTGDPPEAQASFDSIAGAITGMFDFEARPICCRSCLIRKPAKSATASDGGTLPARTSGSGLRQFLAASPRLGTRTTARPRRASEEERGTLVRDLRRAHAAVRCLP